MIGPEAKNPDTSVVYRVAKILARELQSRKAKSIVCWTGAPLKSIALCILLHVHYHPRDAVALTNFDYP